MENKMFLIQGLFFTEDYALSIGFDPEIGERVRMQPAVFRTMFAGVIRLSDDDKNEGALLDHYGDSILTNIKLTENKLSFIKKYERRNDTIQYELIKKNDSFIGFYNGSATGKGAVRCVLQPIEENFFMPVGLENFFK